MTHKGWLTRENAKQLASEKLVQIYKYVSSRQADHQVLSEQHADAINTVNAATRGLMQSLFYSSVGVVLGDPPEEGETLYISSAPIGGNASTLDVYPWTHWVGRVATQLREAFEKGESLNHLTYGPPGKQTEREVGPLVLYRLENRQVTDCQFCAPSAHLGAGEGDDATSVNVLEMPLEFDEFEDSATTDGLKSITETFDVGQDDMVRGPVQGAFLVTGGPGTGKTSIALHRIPYLIWVSSQPQQDTGIQCAVEFSIEQTVVLVWKPHLVSYLRDCLGKLLNVQVPESNVRHIDKWVTDQLQSYVTFSTKGWRLDTPPVEVETVKKRLTEDDLYDFLRSPHGLKQKAEDAFRKALPEGLSPTLKSTLDDLRMLPRAPFSVGSIAFSVAGYQNTADLLRQQFPDSGSRFSESQNVELREIRRKIRDAVTAAMPFVSNYCQLLFDFYESQIFLEGLPDPERRSFVTNVRQQREGRKLSRFDTYVLLWLIHLITDGSTSGQQKVRPLPKLTHIVVDEAQYYEPLVLRLFGSLVDLPRGVLTIVGDLEQRFAHDGGIADWSEAGLSFDSDCRCHLEANYRWTPEIFQFLDDFGLHAEIGERLARPYKFRVDGGLSPEVFSAATRRDELDAIAEKISELKEYDSSDDWTIAVIVPKEMTNEVKGILMPELVHRFIDCEWPIQKNVKPTTDHVVFTDYNSVVGLEFDAVFCPAVDIPLVRNTVDDRQALWVALTRARKFVFVSHGQVPVLFDHADFDAFRTGASIENLDLPPDTIIPNDHDDPTEDEVDTAPAQTVLTWQAMTAKDWFVLSKWARENDQLNGWERRFSYSQGVRESDGGEPSKKQALKANQILAKAVEGGYQKDASASGETE